MPVNYEYEPLFLKNNPINISKFVRHNSNGRIHWHEAIELLYFTRGKAVTACNLQEYNVSKGTIVLVNGNELHTGIITQQDSEYYCIQLDPNFFHNLIGCEYILFQNIIQDADCTKLLDKLIDLGVGKLPAKSILESKKLAYEFFVLLLDRYSKDVLDENLYKKQFKKLDTFNHIIHYFDKHYMEDLTILDLAKNFNMSTSYFSHFFKQYAQKSVIEYINELRVLRAKTFLEKEEASISEIATRVGFSDINYFSRKFKAISGITPTEYRNNCKK